MTVWMIAFLAILVPLTLFALWKWYEMRSADAPQPERQVFARFAFGLTLFWLFAAAMYFGAPLLGK